jgi:Mrp family chromosome partitioning ATPase
VPYPPPSLAAIEPAAIEPVPLSVPPLSDDEPTRLVANVNLKAPADLLEPSGPAPAPWPVEESIHRVPAPSPPEQAPSPRQVLPSIPPEPALPRVPSVPPPARARLQSTPDFDLRAATPRIVAYEFDPEGDDLSVPRTQIAAHTVKLPVAVDPLLVVLTDAYSPRADAYRTLRRKLAGLPAIRVLGVASAEPGEGKTTFAVNLALSLRESTRSRVLVVEANLRAPRIGQLLGFDTPECFIDQLQRHAEDPRAPWVVAEPLPKLHVMAVDPRATHEPLLDPVTFAAGMERIKQAGYEYVVVDSPPVLGNLDCNVISDAVDAMILTALPMKSHRRQMRKAVEQLEPAPILGVVVLEA